MSLAELLKRAAANEHGVASHVLSTGATLFCCVDKVAGRSIVRKHYRTTYRLAAVGEEFSKPISHAAADALVREELLAPSREPPEKRL